MTIGNNSFKKKGFKSIYTCMSEVNDTDIVFSSSYQTRNKCIQKKHSLDLVFCCLEE